LSYTNGCLKNFVLNDKNTLFSALCWVYIHKVLTLSFKRPASHFEFETPGLEWKPKQQSCIYWQCDKHLICDNLIVFVNEPKGWEPLWLGSPFKNIDAKQFFFLIVFLFYLQMTETIFVQLSCSAWLRSFTV